MPWDGLHKRILFDHRAGRMPWDGLHKRILFESQDPDSTASGSETQEARPGWPPDDMCADLTQYRGSFDD